MKITFPNGEFRPWSPSDVPDLIRLADNRNVWRNLRDGFPNPYTKRDAKSWIRTVSLQLPCAHFALAANGSPVDGTMVGGSLVGGIGIVLKDDIHKGTAEIGYWLGEPHWGKGIMTGALRSFTEYAFKTFKLRRLYAQVLEWNPASMRVLEKAGYSLEGRMRRSAMKDGVVADEMLYAKVR